MESDPNSKKTSIQNWGLTPVESASVQSDLIPSAYDPASPN